MDRNYWKEYWDNYYKFMAVYLREVQDAYPDVDIKSEYTEVSSLFEPSMPLEDYDEYADAGDNNYSEENNDPPFILPGQSQSATPSTSTGGGQFAVPSTSTGGGQSPAPFMSPGQSQSATPSTSPGQGQSATPFIAPGGGQSSTPFISPGGGQFTINNCRRMAIVRIVMRRGFSPSEFFLIVDRTDRRSIQGFRIACEGGRIRFVPMAVEYRNINLIECAF